MNLMDRVVVVTGAGSGIGRSGALKMAREGAIIIVSDRDTESATATTKAIIADGGRADCHTVDVTSDYELKRFLEGVISKHKRIDVLHSHAGVQIEGTLEQVAPDGMDASWSLNVRSHFMAARLVVPQMKAQGGGAIVVTASNSGVLYDREMIAYATTKHAVIAMVRQIALDYARYNIRINALCPGWVDTPFNAPFMKQMGGRKALENYVASQIPMGRWASTDEIAEAILFLASDRSSFMTGQALVIDGGECLG